MDIFLDSSMVEHPTVNRTVLGSSPSRGAFWFRPYPQSRTQFKSNRRDYVFERSPSAITSKGFLIARTRCPSSGRQFKNTISTLCSVVGGKPLAAKRLRKFKKFRRQLGRFGVGAVQNIQLQLD